MTAHPAGCLLSLTVVPRSGKNAIEQSPDGALRIRVTAPPVDGSANTAVLRYLAECFGIPRSNLVIVTGESRRRKRILVLGLAPDDLEHRLRQARASTR